MSTVKISIQVSLETKAAVNAILSRYGLSLNESVLALFKKSIADGVFACLPQSMRTMLTEAADVAAEEMRRKNSGGE